MTVTNGQTYSNVKNEVNRKDIKSLRHLVWS